MNKKFNKMKYKMRKAIGTNSSYKTKKDTINKMKWGDY